ncbi:pyridoxamine 5'-phosphate oxidase family protein [Oerskovia sp. Sa1BUA8]|uniref:Pyridoxamine 5'-phosphate oxidase family protein n=1 Tax=Oerskovia douganii TaxID=2762210 RepID=A0A9D5UJ12_9CELL|nr:pyridoxamine 5'-phosphate oxidase family protein [Oerskovia douganii]MBE7701442.1 pyridoxamine 5'-phosphate oxidase family protein [Oerskovia douganii]
MVPWKHLVDDAPDLAARVRSRFEAAGQHVLATRTLTGSPRVSGTEVGFWGDEVWVGSTSRSGKSMDLLVDPRCVLHSNPGDGSRTQGDVQVDATVRALAKDAPRRAEVLAAAGRTEPFQLFWLDLVRVRLTTVVDDATRVETWRPGTGVHVDVHPT